MPKSSAILTNFKKSILLQEIGSYLLLYFLFLIAVRSWIESVSFIILSYPYKIPSEKRKEKRRTKAKCLKISVIRRNGQEGSLIIYTVCLKSPHKSHFEKSNKVGKFKIEWAQFKHHRVLQNQKPSNYIRQILILTFFCKKKMYFSEIYLFQVW